MWKTIMYVMLSLEQQAGKQIAVCVICYRLKIKSDDNFQGSYEEWKEREGSKIGQFEKADLSYTQFLKYKMRKTLGQKAFKTSIALTMKAVIYL